MGNLTKKTEWPLLGSVHNCTTNSPVRNEKLACMFPLIRVDVCEILGAESHLAVSRNALIKKKEKLAKGNFVLTSSLIYCISPILSFFFCQCDLLF